MALKEDKPYTYDDLTRAVRDYEHAADLLKEAQRQVEVKRGEMKSFQVDADRHQEEVDRRRVEVRKIIGNLEK